MGGHDFIPRMYIQIPKLRNHASPEDTLRGRSQWHMPAMDGPSSDLWFPFPEIAKGGVTAMPLVPPSAMSEPLSLSRTKVKTWLCFVSTKSWDPAALGIQQCSTVACCIDRLAAGA